MFSVFRHGLTRCELGMKGVSFRIPVSVALLIVHFEWISLLISFLINSRTWSVCAVAYKSTRTPRVFQESALKNSYFDRSLRVCKVQPVAGWLIFLIRRFCTDEIVFRSYNRIELSEQIFLIFGAFSTVKISTCEIPFEKLLIFPRQSLFLLTRKLITVTRYALLGCKFL